MRRWLFVLVPVIVVAAVAAIAVVRAPSFLAPRLEAALTRAIGHPATIRGGVRLGWSGGPTVEIGDLAVANAAWGSRMDMLRVPLVTATLDIAALLHGVVRIPSVRVMSPDLMLETDAAGHGNWERVPAPPSAAPAGPSTTAGPAVQVETIVVVGGHLAFRDGTSDRVYQATLDATARAASDPVDVTATLHAPQADLRIEASVARADPLRRSSLTLTGQVLVPEPLDVAAKLSPGQAGLAASLQVHGSGLEASLAGVLDPAARRPVGPVTLDATLTEGAALAARFGVPTPARLHVLLRQQDDGITLRDLNAVLPAGDMAGELDVALATPPTLRGSLTSQRLDLARLLAPPAPTASQAPAAAPPAASPAPPPDARLNFAVLDRANADLRLAVVELHDGAVVIRDMAGHLVVQDGRLVLDPFGGTGPGGRVTLSTRVDGRASPPTMAVTLHAPALALQPILALTGLPGNVGGTAAIEADLRASGTTQPEVLRSLGGRASVSMGDGEIDLHVLSEVFAAARLPIDPHGRAHLRCLLVRADIANGVATLAPLLIDATNVLVQGTGTVDLAQQTLALRLRPLLRTGPGLVIPVTLSGPWAKPKLDVDRGNLAGVLQGLTSSSGDACQAAGITSTVPLPARKPLKPADLLRSLLR